MRKQLLSIGCALSFALLLSVPAAHAEWTNAAAAQSTDPLAALFTPAPISLASCTPCIGSYTTSPGGGAASHWGMGSSCTAAQTDLTNQTRSAANAVCFDIDDYGVCSFSVVVTAACWSPSYGTYQVDGYANFKCRIWTGGPGCNIP